MISERKVTFDVPSVDYVELINKFQADVDALLVAHDTVMNHNHEAYTLGLSDLTRFFKDKDKLCDIDFFNNEKTRMDNHWIEVRNKKYQRLCDLLNNLEEQYCEIDPMFKGMSRRLPFLEMIKELKNQPLDYFRSVKKRSTKLENKFY